MSFQEIEISDINAIPLFEGIEEEVLKKLLFCMGAKIKEYKKEEYIIHCNEDVNVVGVILSGSVQMIREDLWGNKTLLASMREREVFGETFACGIYKNATVAFVASTNACILFLQFDHVMHSCNNACSFHHKLIGNIPPSCFFV